MSQKHRIKKQTHTHTHIKQNKKREREREKERNVSHSDTRSHRFHVPVGSKHRMQVRTRQNQRNTGTPDRSIKKKKTKKNEMTKIAVLTSLTAPAYRHQAPLIQFVRRRSNSPRRFFRTCRLLLIRSHPPPPNFFSSFLFPFSIYLSISFLTNQYRSGIYGTSRKNQTATSCGENYTLTLHTQTHTQTHTRCEEFCDESVLTDWVLATRKEMEEWRERERERERKREREKEKGKKTICLKLPIKVDGGYKTAYPSSITVKEGI